MKIAQITATYPPYQGGMGNVAQSFSQQLAKKGHKIIVFAPKYENGLADRQEQGIKVKYLKPLFKFGNAAFLPQLYKQLKQADFDIIHLHYPFFGGAETICLYKLFNPKVKLVITYHMDVLGRGLSYKAFFFLYRLIVLPFIVRSADKITCSTFDYIGYSFIKNYYGKNPDKFVEIPFGVAREYDWPIETPKFNQKKMIFIGGLDPAHYFKGLHELLRALAIINDKSISLNIIGEGSLKEFYQEQAKLFKINDQVEFLGKVSKQEKINQLKQANLLVLPSTDKSEAFGIVLVEAMACGTPVIVSDLPGPRRVIEANQTGLLVQPGSYQDLAEKIKKVLADDRLLSQMSAKSIKRVEAGYRWPQIIDKLIKAYQNA